MLINEESLRSASPYGSDMHGVPGCCVFVLQLQLSCEEQMGPKSYHFMVAWTPRPGLRA